MDTQIYKAVNAWNYYLLNFNSPGYIRSYFKEIFGEVMGEHFMNKFDYFCQKREPESALVTLWCEMTEANRELWLNWLVEHYNEFRK